MTITSIFAGGLRGFTNIGDINTHLLEFERSLDDSTVEPPLANSMLVLMVRGLFTRMQFPYAQFPCTALSGDMMFDPFWEAVCRLERCDFKVLGATADGLSANRRLFKLHGTGGVASQLVYKVPNPYSMEERNIYFISDPPHLMKTVRNGWASQKRKLWVSAKYIYMLDSLSVRVHIYFQCDGKEISWRHLEDLYRRNRGETGLVLVPKLKYEHIRLTSFSKMRVDLATQVSTSLYMSTFTFICDPFEWLHATGSQ